MEMASEGQIVHHRAWNAGSWARCLGWDRSGWADDRLLSAVATAATVCSHAERTSEGVLEFFNPSLIERLAAVHLASDEVGGFILQTLPPGSLEVLLRTRVVEGRGDDSYALTSPLGEQVAKEATRRHAEENGEIQKARAVAVEASEALHERIGRMSSRVGSKTLTF